MKRKERYKISYWFSLALGLLLVFVLQCTVVKAAETGTLTIRKFQVENYENLKQSTGQERDKDDIPADAKVIADVEFKVEKLFVDARNGDSSQEITPSTPIDTSFSAITKYTDNAGEAKFSNLEEGYYLVTETIPEEYSARGAGKFVVSIPIKSTDASGNTTVNYDVVVYPKNQKGTIDEPAKDEPTSPSLTPAVKLMDDGKSAPASNVRTGDSTQLIGLALLAVASLEIIIVVIKRRKVSSR